MPRVLVLTSLVLGSWVPLLPGQTYHAGLRGVVQDPGGGVLPGATVAISDDSTGFTRVSVTNEVGQYAFTDVQPAVYTVRAELDGFAPFEQRGVELSVQRFLVLDIRLELGAVREAITVTSESPVLENATASVASSLEHVELVTLPTPREILSSLRSQRRASFLRECPSSRSAPSPVGRMSKGGKRMAERVILVV